MMTETAYPASGRCCSGIEVSLRTKSPDFAHSIAAEVIRASEHLIRRMKQSMISADAPRPILNKVSISHSTKFNSVAAAEIAYGDSSKSRRTMDILTG